MHATTEKRIAPFAICLLVLALSASVISCQSSGQSRPEGGLAAGPGGSGGPGGQPPSGPPPSGNPPNGSGGGNPPGQGQAPGGQNGSKGVPSSFAGVYLQTGGLALIADKAYRSDKADTSGIVVTGGGSLVGSDLRIETSGKSSSLENSSFYGLDSGILALKGSGLRLSRVAVTTTGDGANGIFANGEGSFVALAGGSVTATGQGAHAIMASRGGSLEAVDIDMSTSGANSGAIATDRGGGTILVRGGSVKTSGPDSPGIYSTGSVSVRDAKIAASGAEAAVIEGANSILLEDSELSSSKEGKWGVMVYQSMSGDASGSSGRFAMRGGRLAYEAATGPLFYVTNSTGIVSLSGVELSAPSGILAKAEAGRWGKTGSNGGSLVLLAEGQSLAGDLVADRLSSLALVLEKGSSWTGAVDTARTARSVSVRLDAASSWKLGADSRVTILAEPEGVTGETIANILSGGHKLYYKASANPWLGGKTYPLPEGGTLIPY